MAIQPKFESGDRVRVLQSESEYTGCRGTVVDDPQAAGSNVTPLGHFVAIDGENGVLRPFLVQDLELLRPARVRHPMHAEHAPDVARARDRD